MENEKFKKAKGIWTVEKKDEMNVTCVFKTQISKGEYDLRITAANVYQVIINGELFAYGPARAAHGYARIDEYKVRVEKETDILIVVAGYKCFSFCNLNQDPFLQAEILSSGEVIRATGVNGDFTCRVLTEKLQKVARYSYQRAFTESYAFSRSVSDTYLQNEESSEVYELESKKYMPRGVSYPIYTKANSSEIEIGEYTVNEGMKFVPQDSRVLESKTIGVYPLETLESKPFEYLAKLEYHPSKDLKKKNLTAGEYITFDFGRIEVGFTETTFEAKQDSKIIILFDEIADTSDGMAKIDFNRNDSINVIEYRVKKGEFKHISLEAYSIKAAKIIVEEGEIENVKLSLIRYENPDCYDYKPNTNDKKIAAILEAAVRTFRHNAIDALNDCASRERASWLCDASFTAEAEYLFNKNNKIENNFLENMALSPDKLNNLPEGMIPTIYPVDFGEVNFIPNWSLWWIKELYENSKRTNSRKFIDLSKKKAENLFKYFSRFENEFGLLENLEGGIFVEWSKANEFVNGVNYPTNMLYAYALEKAGEMYDRKDWIDKAEKIREVIRIQAYDGKFFIDNAIRKDGKLVLTGNKSEVCQYYAYIFGTATKKEYSALWQLLVNEFGPKRDASKTYPEVCLAKVFMGYYFRLILLLDDGDNKKVYDETVDYFYDMAVKTDTLWEHDRVFRSSLDQGFASYLAVILSKIIK